MHGFLAAAAAFAALSVFAAVAGRRFVPSPPAAVAVVVLAAAVAGGLLPGSPSGAAWFDALLRVAAVAVVVGVGAYAPLVVLALGGVALAAAAGHGPAAWAAGGAAGAAVAMVVGGVDARVLRAAVAAALALAAFDLERPTVDGGTGAVAVGVLAVVVLGGMARLPGRERRWAWAGAGVLAVVVVAATAGGVLAALGARRHVESGVDAARSGLTAARRGDTAPAAEALDRAQASFEAGRQRMEPWWARPAAAVPVVAQHRRALASLTATGAEVAAAGSRLARASDPAGLRVESGRVPLEAVRSLEGSAAEAERVLSEALEELGDVASPWLVAPVGDRLEDLTSRIERALGEAHSLAAATRLARPMLGADGERHYFLALQTPAEGRGAGGFLGSFAELSAVEGALRLGRVGRTSDLNTGGGPRQVTAPDDYLDRYGRFDPHLLWQNVNMTPDFPTAAGVMAGLYPQSGGRPVDGVIAIDPHGLAAVLRAVGPVSVARWPVPITADNAVPVLLHEQYVRFQGANRVDFLADVMEAVWQRITTRPSGLVELGRALGGAVADKHVMVAATRVEEQAGLVELGVAGAMAPVEDDFVGLVTQNAGGNKIDWFLHRALDYRVEVDPASGEVSAVATVTLTNRSPAQGLPDYVIGSALKPPLPTGTNRTYLSLYSPWGVRGATLGGQPFSLESQDELGRYVYSAYVDIPPGGSVVLEVQLAGTRPRGAGPYEVVVHRQPVVHPDDVRVSVAAADGEWEVCGLRGCSAERSADVALVRDRRLSWRLAAR